MQRSLADLCEKLSCTLVGDSSVMVDHIASVESANARSLTFVEDSKNLAAALGSQAGAVIAGKFASDAASGKPLLISPNPRLTFARASKLLRDGQSRGAIIHPSAVIAGSAKLGNNVRVGPYVVIEDDVTIGNGSTIGAGCMIEANVTVGLECRIGPHVTIHRATTIGNRIFIQGGAVLGSEGFGYVRDPETGRFEQFPQVGSLVIEDDVEIGANCTIDRGALDETRIGRGTKIDNLVHIGHNVQIGENVMMSAQVGLSGSVTVENDVTMAGQVGVGDHARIEAGVILGGQSGIPSKKVVRGDGVVYLGAPARPVKDQLKELALLARLAKKRG